MKRFRYIVLFVTLALMFPLSQVVGRAVSGTSGSDAAAAVPGLFAGSGYFICAGIAVALFISLLLFSSVRGWIVYAPVLLYSLVIFLSFWAIFALGYLAVAVVSGLTGMAAYIGIPSLIALIYLILFFRLRRKAVNLATASSVRLSAAAKGAAKYDFKVLYGGLTALLAVALVELCLGNPTYFLMVPFSAVCLALILWRASGLRLFLLCGALAVVLFVLVFCVPIISGTEISSFLRILVYSLLYLSLITPLADLYCQRDTVI